MARPKTKSALVQGISELVESLRSIESQLNALSKNQKSSRGPGRPSSGRGPGRPAGKRGRGRPDGSGRGPGRPAGSGRGPGRPAGSGRGPGRPRSIQAGRTKRRGRGRPPGSKNKAA
jgi:hypothetical protein